MALRNTGRPNRRNAAGSRRSSQRPSKRTNQNAARPNRPQSNRQKKSAPGTASSRPSARQLRAASSRRVDSSVLHSIEENRKAKRNAPSGSRRDRSLDGFGGAESGRNSGRGGLSGRGKAPSQTSPQLVMGIVAGVVMILGLALFVFSGDSKSYGKRRQGNDNLPAHAWVQRAQKAEKSGNPFKAADCYSSAAEAAQRAGDERGAQRYSMKAYSLRKHTPINVR